MDRDRLKQVQQTDLTESRVNQDFVLWLKEKGPTYLLVILVALVAGVLWLRIREGRAAGYDNAFVDLELNTTPEALELVAEDHAGVGSVAELAIRRAAEAHLFAVQTRRDLEAPAVTLTDEQVVHHRTKAAELYRRLIADTESDPARRLFAINAHFGLAALAESQGDAAAARAEYEAIKSLAAGSTYAIHRDQADQRLASLDAILAVPALKSRADLPQTSPLDPFLRDILSSAVAELAAGDASTDTNANAPSSTGESSTSDSPTNPPGEGG